MATTVRFGDRAVIVNNLAWKTLASWIGRRVVSSAEGDEVRCLLPLVAYRFHHNDEAAIGCIDRRLDEFVIGDNRAAFVALLRDARTSPESVITTTREFSIDGQEADWIEDGFGIVNEDTTFLVTHCIDALLSLVDR
jgi:hypothetical protein